MPKAVTSSDTGGIRFLLDGKVVTVDAIEPTKSVLNFLREDLGRTGTKEGCAEGDCGACTVVVGEIDGDAVTMKTVKRLHPVRPGTRWQGAVHRGRLAPVERRSAPGAASDGRLPWLAVRFLHSGIRDVAVGALFSSTRRGKPGRPAPRSAARSPAIFAGAPGIGRSSKPANACSNCRACRSIGMRCTASCARSRAPVPMRSSMTVAVFFAPRTVAELTDLRATHPRATILAGNTDIGLG